MTKTPPSARRERRESRWLSRRGFLSLAGVAGLLGVGSTAGCSFEENPQKTVLRGTTMGTYYAITYLATAKTPPQAEVRDKVEARFAAINHQMSTFIPESELSRFNQFRKVDTPFPVSPEVITVMREAVRLNKVAEGKLDVTVGPLVNLWGFGPEGRPNKIPNDAQIDETKAKCGIEHLEVLDNALVKKIPEFYVDLSSIAKGYGVDSIAWELEALGVERYLIDVGGEVRGQGAGTRGGPWRVAVERPVPHGDASLDRVIHLVNTSVATSGDYRNYFEENGHRFSHTIDPQTGRPITHNLASVTVMDASCMTADGLATGLDVLGPEEGMKQATKLNLACIMIVKEDGAFREITSPAWRRQMQ